ncbi:unspecified product [Plasmodium malariae]|uniref:Unspecified product n=1 Tax=Plasmodium malariae TaxID=5858 RepID=A0A1A8X586_PLAMA|nr:unspecified product [Plasmodium malariae]
MTSISVKLWNKKVNLNNMLDVRGNRLLYGETDLYSQQSYEYLKENAKNIVNEDKYIFGNKLNTLMSNFYLPEDFKILLNEEQYQKQNNSLEFKDNLNNSNDSLISDASTDTRYAELKEEPFRMKTRKSKKQNISSLIHEYLKKLDKKYEKEVVKLLTSGFKRSNKIILGDKDITLDSDSLTSIN